MNSVPTQSVIEEQVQAHINRLKDRVDIGQDKVSLESANVDPQFVDEDKVALEQVNTVLKDEIFRKRLCAGLGKTSSDLGQIAKPLVSLLLPASAVKGGTIVLLGYSWTFATLPIGIIGASILAIYLARFGIAYYCED